MGMVIIMITVTITIIETITTIITHKDKYMEYVDLDKDESILYETVETIVDNYKSGKIMLENVTEDTITINIVCDKCKSIIEIEVYKEDYDNYIMNNYDIDTCFFYISQEKRDTLKTHICEKCLKNM